MRLSAIRLENFRGYSDAIEISFDPLTVLVGKNEAGKSSVLDALAIFFEQEPISLDDGCNYGDKSAVLIECQFSDLPAEIFIDRAAPTSLAAEHLLDASGYLTIRKRYNLAGDTISGKTVNLNALHPQATHADDLIQLKIADLKARADELGVDTTGVNRSISAELRQAIRHHLGDLDLAERELSLMKDEGKKVWEALKAQLPVYALFRSDRPSTDQDAEAQDPLKLAVREALASLAPQLSAIEDEVRRQLEDVAKRTLEKLDEMDPDIASSLSPTFKSLKWDSVFKPSIVGDDDVPLNKRGSGVRRLILLNFFRAKAEELSEKNEHAPVIYAVEEPETSQHPRNQRLLANAFRDLSEQSSRQVIITTHTPTLARVLPDTSLRHISRSGTRVEIKDAATDDRKREIANTLGVLPDHNVRLFIAVEGTNDFEFLKAVSRIFHRHDPVRYVDLSTLEGNGEIIFVPMNGGTLILWAAESAHGTRLEPLGLKEFHILDRDAQPPAPATYQAHADRVNGLDGKEAVITRKREMENYVSPSAIQMAYANNGLNITLPPQFSDFDDVPMLVAAAVAQAGGIEWDRLLNEDKKKKANNAKRLINRQAVALMDYSELNNIDVDNEIASWLQRISQLTSN